MNFNKSNGHDRTIEHIFSGDEAIDQAHPDYDPGKYLDTGDVKYLPLKNGTEPARFQVRALTASARELLEHMLRMGTIDGAGALWWACRLGLVGVKAHYADGSEVSLSSYVERDAIHGVTRLSDAGMDFLHAAAATADFPQGSNLLIWNLGARIQRETYGNPLASRASS
jgi:hypothetical protein